MENEVLAGSVAIVTGGTGGIGRATALALAKRGCAVAIVDRDPARIERVCEEIANLTMAQGGVPRALGLALDVTREQDMNDMASQVVAALGRIDILVTCAGILRFPGSLPKPMVQLTESEWDFVLDVNLKGVFLSNRAVLAAMMRQRSGTIINVSSTSGQQGRAHDSAYCASKFGVIGLTESLAEEVRPYAIRVQAVLPDAVDTPLWDQNGPIRPEHALPAERVGGLIAFMASLPADTIMQAPVIAPFRTRKRMAKARDIPAGENNSALDPGRTA